MFKHQHASLNQWNEQLNDAFETYFAKSEFGPCRQLAYKAMSVSLLLGLRLRIQAFGGRVQVNERIIEYPQILRWIRPHGTVLDVGCVSSRLPIQLASLGYDVHGVDTRSYPYTHPNFHFHRADIFEWVPQQPFDVVLLVSTLEHLGLGEYGDLALPEADREAVERVADWLSPKGQLLVSVPFGKAAVTKKHRIYNLERLRFLFSSFEWVDQAYFQRVEGQWLPSDENRLRDVASPELPVNGVACLNLQGA
jgi:SAM-dependent methyltransferase